MVFTTKSRLYMQLDGTVNTKKTQHIFKTLENSTICHQNTPIDFVMGPDFMQTLGQAL
jgi:hypothetical protein